MRTVIPFYSNTSDDTHCVQACFKMILKYFSPSEEFNWKELDNLTKKKPAKGTWWFPAETELIRKGFIVKEISPFDYKIFLQKGKEYLYSIYDTEQADWYIKNSNIVDVKKHIPDFLNSVSIEIRKATVQDFVSLLNEGHLIISDVNACALYNKLGYVSHAVVVFDTDGENFVIHDPGLPPRESLTVTTQTFLNAGGDNLVAIKKPN